MTLPEEPKPIVLSEEMQAVATHITEQLNETDAKPVRQIAQIVQLCGVEFAQQLLQETLEIEAQGGMMLPDDSRRRTVGGVFFYLARSRIERKLMRKIFPFTPSQKETSAQPTVPEFHWQERLDVLRPLLDEKGELTTVKVTLIGRPGRIETRKDLVITTMTHVIKSPTLPKGVPTPPQTPTVYTVYIGAKQWRRVEEAIKDPADALIIEGICTFDQDIGAMAVFANGVTTKNIETKKRQEQKEAVASTPAPAAAVSSRVQAVAAPPEVAAPPATSPTSHFPPEVAQKLAELQASASLFRQKIAAIRSKPADQQSGLEMTQKLLKKVEDEIAALEKKYAS
jgi:hypothetical protein